MQKRPLVILSGPTAVGKTELSLKLASRIGGEIISADSMQVYRGMDIGTAKLPKNEMQGIKHHLIDIIDPDEDWNVLKFTEYAKAAMDEIYAAGHIPIVAGGTGFYIQALLYDVDFTDENNGEIRKRLEKEADELGAEALHERLKTVDPESADIIHANNVKRVIRALEFYELNGYPISEHNKNQAEKESPYNYIYFVLTDDRQKLYERIDKRVDIMMSEGLIEEVKKLKETGLNRNHVSMQGLGYKEILAYLDGELSLDEAVYILKRDTRHFAKRQLTWFRREKDVCFIDKGAFINDEEILAYMLDMMKSKKLIGI